MMDFSEALKHLKQGAKMSRKNWNGKGLYVVYQKGYPDGVAINKNTAEATGIPEGTVIKFRPYLMLKSINDEFVPWAPSHSDILMDDWVVV